MSPEFGGNYKTVRKVHASELHIKANESLFIAFKLFRLFPCGVEGIEIPWYDEPYYLESLELEEIVSHGTKWKKDGIQHFGPRIFRNSIRLTLRRSETGCPGFRMVFAITPKFEEPEKLPDGLYNCSVPSYRYFKPVLHCNHLVECVDGEDEKDCDFHSEECGEGMIDAGTKCYKLFRNRKEITWYNASSNCVKENMQLLTIASQKEQEFLIKLLMQFGNFSGFFVGAKPFIFNMTQQVFALYNRFMWRWTDGRTGFYMRFDPDKEILTDVTQDHCGQLFLTRLPFWQNYQLTFLIHSSMCDAGYFVDVLCEREKAKSGTTERVQFLHTTALNLSRWNERSFVQCPRGHMTRTALSCDSGSDCGVTGVTSPCRSHRDLVQVPLFQCQHSKQSLHYSLICDHIDHCLDKTDENFCQFPSCHPTMFQCTNFQCVIPKKVCDKTVDCLDGTDEKCKDRRLDTIGRSVERSVVHMVASGQHWFVPMSNSSDCPATHFLCPFGDCLPVFLRCNGINDCPGREDEAECEDYTCPGFYRCWGKEGLAEYKVCLHPDYLCDGVWHCPKHDDEMLCDPRCPDVCHCQGLTFVCSGYFNTTSYPNLRLLDASGSNTTLTGLGSNFFLIHLNMSRCNIENVVNITFQNLKILDLSSNKIVILDIQSFTGMDNLLFIDLSSNPLSVLHNTRNLQLNVRHINLSNTSLQVYNSNVFAGFHLLRNLNISNSKITTVTHEGFQTTPHLKSLDARGCPLSAFPTDVIKNLEHLTTIYVDNYKLCCPVMLPRHFDTGSCHTKHDLLSSCEDLLKSISYRIFLWIFAIFAIVGNVCSFVSRLYLRTSNSTSGKGGFGVFVSSLCLADCLMGVYLTIVGANDHKYQGQYLFHDDVWKKSSTCHLAGVLSLLSSEVSAFMISLITLDRLLVIRFPFSQVHFKGRSAMVVCVAMWTIGLVLATIPLLPVTSHWQFFSQTGICVPLPFSGSDTFHGYTFSFAVMIVLNFILFVLIACGQAVIYWSVRTSIMDSSNQANSTREAKVARRLITVALSDFLCWFPVGLLGVLGSTGTAIPDEVNVAVAIFVLPLNSALNPFLYTLNVVKEKRNKAKERRLIKQLETKMAVSQIKAWLQSRVIVEGDLL